MSIENYLIFEAYKTMKAEPKVKNIEPIAKKIAVKEDENDPGEMDDGEEFDDASGVEIDPDEMTPEEKAKGTKGSNRYGSIYDSAKGQRAQYANTILKNYAKYANSDQKVIQYKGVCHEPGDYINFTGKIDCRGGTGTVKNADFTISNAKRIFFDRGVWEDGEFRKGTFTGIFKGGTFKAGALFAGGIFEGGTMDGGVFQAGVFKGATWLRGDGTNTKVNFVITVKDAQGKEHVSLPLAELYNATYPATKNPYIMKKINAMGFYYRNGNWLNEEGDAVVPKELQKIKAVVETIREKARRELDASYSTAMAPELIGRPAQRSTKNPATGVDVTGTNDNDEESGSLADIKADVGSSDAIGKYSAGSGAGLDDEEDVFTREIEQGEREDEKNRKIEQMRDQNKELGLDTDMVDDELADDEAAIAKKLADAGVADEEPADLEDEEKIKQHNEKLRRENIKSLAQKGRTPTDRALAQKWRQENRI